MRDLNHPNEYIRGSTLRLVGKLKEPELVEPLVESVKNNLSQRHSYVRRNAVLAIYSIYKEMPQLIPDAGDIILDYLEKETDASCKRNAFLMLFNTHPDKALSYLMSVMDQVASFGEVLQLIVLEMIRRVSRGSSAPSGQPGSNANVVPLGARRMAFIRVIFTLLASSVKSQAVQYEAAVTLLSLSRAPTAIKAASQALMNILSQASDNNIKMVVLDKINDIKQRHAKVIQEQVMDILRVLTSNPHLDIVRKTLSIALDLVTPKNIAEVVSLLKKEIAKSQSEEFEKGGEYRQVLVQALRTTAIRYPDIAADVVLQLLEFLGDSNPNAALDVVLFVREVMHRYPHSRVTIIQTIIDSYFNNITSPAVFTPVLWLIGEYAGLTSEAALRHAISKVSELLVGHVEYSAIDGSKSSSNVASGTSTPAAPEEKKVSTRPVILADGSYASASALLPAGGNTNVIATQSIVLASIVKGGALAAADYFLASAAATALTKLALRARQMSVPDANRMYAKVLLVLVRFVRLRNQVSNVAANAAVSPAASSTPPLNVAAAASIATPLANSSATASLAVVDPDSQDWFFTCIQLLTTPEHAQLAMDVFLSKTQKAFAEMMEYQQQQKEHDASVQQQLHHSIENGPQVDATTTASSSSSSSSSSKEPKSAQDQNASERDQIRSGVATQADSLIRFGLLRDKRAGMGGIYDDGGAGGDDENEDSIFEIKQDSASASAKSTVVGGIAGTVGSNDLTARMNRVVQLTGLSDPLYVEAVLIVHQYDISLEFTIINQTNDTLSNVTLELATLGDLKLVERPTPYNLAANGKLVVTHHVSISSTETGTIFGAIVYDVAGSTGLGGNTVVLNEIHIDMIDYIQPAVCDDASFRSMWQAFEWDTKVSVSAEASLTDFLQHILHITNMHCLTPLSSAIEQSCGFLAANLYAKSKFGEDALANLSIQRVQGNPGRIQGFIRIRAETRGVADSLHAKILQRMKM